MPFTKLRHQIDSHFAGSPLAKQRAEFLLVNDKTPLERKAHFTSDAVGAAAAFEAMKAFEHHEVHKKEKPTHARAKEIITGLAEGYALKLVDEKGLPFTSNEARSKFKVDAQLAARRDAKRALRQSGLYEVPELDPLDGDEKLGHKVI